MSRRVVLPCGHDSELVPGDTTETAAVNLVCPVCSSGSLAAPRPAVPSPDSTAPQSNARQVLLAPPAVPGYEVLDELGRGGMGVVYRARQNSLKRLVALKMIRAGVHAGPEELVRFRAEAEAVARLQHPNIVQVYEVGEQEGLPYFSLELCTRGSLAQTLAGAALPPGDAARLVETVARAMHAAHQAGIVHRDLKPANVLLDADDTPKVTDFGLAKQLDVPGQTGTGAVLGTPSYMAPEQAKGHKTIGPAADVYGLGAILYECLTGRPPFKAATTMDTLMQVLAEEPVPVRRLQPRTPRDLETVCHKCLEKDPARRYASAEALAEDLRRFRAGLPVAARPIGAPGRALRWVRRRPAVAALLAAVALVATAGAAGVAWEYADAVRQRNLAREQAGKADEAVRQARASEAATRTVLSFFQGKVLAAAGPKGEEGGLGPDATLRDAIAAAEPQIAADFADQPVAEAAIRDTLGNTYIYMGEPQQAVRQLERARDLRRTHLGPDYRDTLDSTSNLANAYYEAGQTAEALTTYEDVLARARTRLGPDDAVTLSSMSGLALTYRAVGRRADAVPLLEEVLGRDKAVHGPEHADTLTTTDNLAQAYLENGRAADAVVLLEPAVKLMKERLGPENHNTLLAMGNLGRAYRATGRVTDAIPITEEAVRLMKARLGPNHPDTLNTMVILARTYLDAGRKDDGLQVLKETLDGYRTKFGDDNPYTLVVMHNLGVAYAEAGRTEDAVRDFEDTLRRRKAVLGPADPETVRTMACLGRVYGTRKEYTQAEPLLAEALRLTRRKDGEASSATAGLQADLGDCLMGEGKFAEAEPLLLASYEGTKQPKAAERLVQLYEAWGRGDKAAEWRKKRPELPPEGSDKGS